MSAPPLPPSPMSEVAETVRFGDVRLPWSALLTAGIAGATSGGMACLLAAVLPDAPFIGIFGGISAALRGVGVAFAGVVADRLPTSWSRAQRWGVVGTVVGLAPAFEYLMLGGAPGGYSGVAVPWNAWYVIIALRDGLFCAALGWAAMSQRGLLWRLPLVGAAVLLAYLFADVSLDGPMGVLSSGWQRPMLVATLAVHFAAAGLLVGLAFAWGLRRGFAAHEAT